MTLAHQDPVYIPIINPRPTLLDRVVQVFDIAVRASMSFIILHEGVKRAKSTLATPKAEATVDAKAGRFTREQRTEAA